MFQKTIKTPSKTALWKLIHYLHYNTSQTQEILEALLSHLGATMMFSLWLQKDFAEGAQMGDAIPGYNQTVKTSTERIMPLVCSHSFLQERGLVCVFEPKWLLWQGVFHIKYHFISPAFNSSAVSNFERLNHVVMSCFPTKIYWKNVGVGIISCKLSNVSMKTDGRLKFTQ